MIFRQPNQSDWEIFSRLACAENWKVPHSEMQLLKGLWAGYARVLDDDKFCGLVTSVSYESSAWIGNLIVPRNLRGKGYGSQLFKSTLASLVEQGLQSVWLTASDQGRSIYEKECFVEVDRIERWVLQPSRPAHAFPLENESSCEKLLRADRLAWGEDRNLLLSALCSDGKVCAVDDAVALLQPGPDFQIIGPWYAQGASHHAHHELLKMMLAAADPDVPVVVDLLASSLLPALCASAGFQCIGQTSLMVYGDTGSIDLKSMVCLASLGSVG